MLSRPIYGGGVCSCESIALSCLLYVQLDRTRESLPLLVQMALTISKQSSSVSSSLKLKSNVVKEKESRMLLSEEMDLSGMGSKSCCFSILMQEEAVMGSGFAVVVSTEQDEVSMAGFGWSIGLGSKGSSLVSTHPNSFKREEKASFLGCGSFSQTILALFKILRRVPMVPSKRAAAEEGGEGNWRGLSRQTRLEGRSC